MLFIENNTAEPETTERVAGILEGLADGKTVALGDFSDNASPTTDADVDAELLRELAEALRGK